MIPDFTLMMVCRNRRVWSELRCWRNCSFLSDRSDEWWSRHKYQNANGCLMNVKHQKHRLQLIYPSMHQMMSTFDLLRVWMRLCTDAYKRGRVPTFRPGGHARRQEVRNKVTMMSESEAVGPVWSRSGTRPVILRPAGTSHVNKTQSRIHFSPALQRNTNDVTKFMLSFSTTFLLT